jgi:hypothetical protein
MEAPTWSVRVAAAQGGRVEVSARGSQWGVSAPVSFDAADRTLTALECLLGALGGDVVSGFLGLAVRRRLAVDHAEAVVRGTLANPLAYLGAVGSEGAPALGPLEVEVFLSSPDHEEDVRATWAEALSRSPLANTFRVFPGIDVRLTLTV